MSQSSSTISVIGLGYIGLPTAAMFASRRRKVIGVDVNRRAVDTINEGRIHIVEPELDIIVHGVVTEGWLRATTRPEPADVFLIAVPTPFTDGHRPDVSYVMAAAEAIAPVLKKGDIVILESTSPVGTTEQLAERLAGVRPDLQFPRGPADSCDVHVAYCPERVLPGQVVRELVQNDRIIGGLTPACSARAAEVYTIFVKGQLLVTNARTAEMCKLTENAFRDVNIAFANELSLICGKLDIDVWELVRLANHHPRVNILKPGAGVGGHCIAVDPWFIVDSAPEQSRLIRTAREVNDTKPDWVLEQVRQEVGRVAKERVTIALLGLAFKPDIDDLRESPAMHVALELARSSEASLLIVEPHVTRLPAELANAHLVSLDDALGRCDVVVVLVAHSAFARLCTALDPRHRVVDAVGVLGERRSRAH